MPVGVGAQFYDIRTGPNFYYSRSFSFLVEIVLSGTLAVLFTNIGLAATVEYSREGVEVHTFLDSCAQLFSSAGHMENLVGKGSDERDFYGLIGSLHVRANQAGLHLN